MRRVKQSQRTLAQLAGYQHGTDAALAAIRCGMARAEAARAVILVEGISDQIAVETAALRLGRDLAGEGVAVFPVGGSGSVRRYLGDHAARDPRPVLAGLFDLDAAHLVSRALRDSRLGDESGVSGLAAQGFHLCQPDLEAELIRAAGVAAVETIIAAEGEAGALATLRKQAEWQGRDAADQLHRFLRSKASRSLRYARLLIETPEPDRIPAPIMAVLDRV